jgi:hypothetical protein
VTREALEQAARAGRRVIVHIYAEEVIYEYPKPQQENRAIISEVPASILLGLIDRGGQGTWEGLAQVAIRQTGKGYAAIEGVYAVSIKSYP